jgi:hypothetical protein
MLVWVLANASRSAGGNNSHTNLFRARNSSGAGINESQNAPIPIKPGF